MVFRFFSKTLLDILISLRFRNESLYHYKESMNYPQIMVCDHVSFLLFLKKYNSLFVNRFNVFSKGFCPKLFLF